MVAMLEVESGYNSSIDLAISDQSQRKKAEKVGNSRRKRDRQRNAEKRMENVDIE